LAGHVLLTEKPRSRALCLGEYRHKKLRAGAVRTTPPLRVARSALDYALTASRMQGLVAIVGCQCFQIVVDI
jgi:hypothetical protein